MKLASFTHAGRAGYGAVIDGAIVDLSHRLAASTLRLALAAHTLADLTEMAARAPADFALTDVTLDVPLPDALGYWCVGRNYRGHLAEANMKLPEFPSLFIRSPRSVVATGQPIIRPRLSGAFDFEGELAIIIGATGRHIHRQDALSHVAGYAIFMDGSVRDYQFKHSLTVGKNFASTGSCGPWIVTADQIADPSQLLLRTRLNGREVQATRTDDFIFDIPTIIAYVSALTPLLPGDIIATGTPEGVGFARTPPLWMQPGDTLEVEISGIGILRNQVIAEPEAQ